MGHNDHLHTNEFNNVPAEKMGAPTRDLGSDEFCPCGFEPMNGRQFEQHRYHCSHSPTKGHTNEIPKGIGGAPTRESTLPDDPAERKTYPVASGVLDYFPDAIVALARLSWQGNQQHNPGKPLHWDRSKSGDEADTMMRHFMRRGTLDKDGIRHSVKMAWRALAFLQKEIENERTEGK